MIETFSTFAVSSVASQPLDEPNSEGLGVSDRCNTFLGCLTGAQHHIFLPSCPLDFG